MGYFEQVHRQIGRVLYGSFAGAFAEVAAHIGEDIKSPFGYGELNTGNLTAEAADQIAPAHKGLSHLLYATLIAGKGFFGGFLCDGTGARRVLSLQFVRRLGDPQRRGNESDTPARHGVCFRYAVDDYNPLFYLGELCDACMFPYIVDMFVDFVRQYDDVRMFD